ncbi:hypothetical protein NFI96_010271 [Prochilodus magdalenae]|nr:hypothetical protein NFI96_010271 [Prochilodus magdalenae]
MATVQTLPLTRDPNNKSINPFFPPSSVESSGCIMGSVGSLIENPDVSPTKSSRAVPQVPERQSNGLLKKGFNQRELLNYLNITKKESKGGKHIISGTSSIKREHSSEEENVYAKVYHKDGKEVDMGKNSLPIGGKFDKGEFGQTQGEFGQTQGEFSQTQGEFGQTQGEFGQTQGEFGQTQGEFSQTQGEFSQTQGEFSQTQGEFGQTQGEFGQTQGEFGQTQGEFGQNLPRFRPSAFKPVTPKNFSSVQNLYVSKTEELTYSSKPASKSLSTSSSSSSPSRGATSANKGVLATPRALSQEAEETASDSGHNSMSSLPPYRPPYRPHLAHISASMGHIDHIGSLDRTSLGLGGGSGPAGRSMATLGRLQGYSSGSEAPPPYELSLSLEEVVRELEDRLQEKEHELRQMRRNLDESEDAIAQVFEGKQRLWEKEMAELKQLYATKLRQVSQQAQRAQRALQLQLYKAQQERGRLQDELQTLRVECQSLQNRGATASSHELQPQLEETQWEDPHRTTTEQCSVGHPLVLHQWSQDADHRTLTTGRCPQDTAHRTQPTGRCPQDADHRTLPRGRCPQEAAHRTLPTERCPQNAAHRTLTTGGSPQEAAHRTLLTGRCSQDAAHRTLPTGRIRLNSFGCPSHAVPAVLVSTPCVLQVCQKAGEISLLKQQLRDSQAEVTQKLSEIFLLKTQLRETRGEMRTRDGQIDLLQLALQAERRKGTAYEDGQTQESRSASGVTEERLRAELLLERRQSEAQASAFEAERSTWQLEKEKVIRYQRELQASYLEMYRKNESLESELRMLRGGGAGAGGARDGGTASAEEEGPPSGLPWIERIESSEI